MIDRLYRVLVDNPRYPAEYDPEWDSPCRVGEPGENNWVEWEPKAIERVPSFAEAEATIGAPVHADARALRTTFFAGTVAGRHSGFEVTLMVPWNERELERAMAELLEHLQVQRKEGLPFTIPVAGTETDVFLSVANDSGAVVLQDFGRDDRVVAPDLKTFLDAIWWPDGRRPRTRT